jgi:hypothetical protein
MPPLTLPDHRVGPTVSPGPLRAFWLVASAGAGLGLAGVTATATRRPALWSLAAPVAAVVALPGLSRPSLVQAPYRRWNGLARRAGRFSVDWTTRVAFEALLLTSDVGELDDPPRRSPGTTAWRARSSQPPGAYRHQDADPQGPVTGDAFERYAQQTGHGWTAAIRFPLALLRSLDTAENVDETPPSNVYTLY